MEIKVMDKIKLILTRLAVIVPAFLVVGFSYWRW